MRPFHAVTIRFGPPLEVGRVTPDGPSQNGSHQNGSHPNGKPDPERLREATDELMRAIATLSGQEYVDQYANRAAARNGPETARSH
jgi:hypothetical protein